MEGKFVVYDSQGELNLRQIADSGQCFRLKEYDADKFIAVTGSHAVDIHRRGDVYIFWCDTNEFQEVWTPYFDLDTDYRTFKAQMQDDPFLQEALNSGGGIRILRQDLWETAVTFTISQRNNIPRIAKSVETLCSNFGTSLKEIGGQRKAICLDGQVLVIAPHEGCIDSDTWLRCRRKCLNVRQIAKPVKAKNTWLAGKIKCIHCGHALSLRAYPRKRAVPARYYVCSTKYVSASCDGIGAVQASDIEDIVFDEMRRKLAEFTELSVKERQGDPIELTKLKVRADEIEKEIATLIDKIVSASPATMEYINKRIDALDEEKKAVREQIAQMSAEMYGKRNMGTISGYINDWERIDMDDKLTVVDALIDNIRVGRGDVQITWKI